VDLDGFFVDTRSSVVVVGFLWSGCVKPRPWWSLLLGVWPARAREFSPAAGTCEPQPVIPVVVDGDRWFRASSASQELLMTARLLYAPAPVSARLLHTPVLVTTLPDAGCLCGLCFMLFLCSSDHRLSL
jgi:hypothetical protein